MGDGEGDVPHGVGVVGTGWPDKRRNRREQDTQRHLLEKSPTVGPGDGGTPHCLPPSPNLSSMCLAPAAFGSFPRNQLSPLPWRRAGLGLGQGEGSLPHQEGRQRPQPAAPHSCPHIATSPVQSLRYQFFFKYLFLPSLPSPIGTPQYFFLFLFYPLFCFLQN